ncbi:MAG: hypothetical protein DMG30_14935 [Acidobacteria bacterium]|nr:MAG: hypothetical protein DMG30_14935 [Acidobacteriota bacterium]
MPSAASEYTPQSAENKKLRITMIEAAAALQVTPDSTSHSRCTRIVMTEKAHTEKTDLLLPGH